MELRSVAGTVTISCLADQLRRDEGWRTYPYKDSVGKQTIGYGRNLDDVGISPQEGDFLLANDIRAAQVSLESHFPWVMALDSVRQGALCNLIFNMGLRSFSEFKEMLGHVQAGEFKAAGMSLLHSKYAQQVGARAQRLAIQLEEGTWQ